jgi:hypothetical protein
MSWREYLFATLKEHLPYWNPKYRLKMKIEIDTLLKKEICYFIRITIKESVLLEINNDCCNNSIIKSKLLVNENWKKNHRKFCKF